jgi:hypothetical protein
MRRVKNKDDRQHTDPADRSNDRHQTDLAEGELETVEESIRIHERKGDLQAEATSEKRGGKETE